MLTSCHAATPSRQQQAAERQRCGWLAEAAKTLEICMAGAANTACGQGASAEPGRGEPGGSDRFTWRSSSRLNFTGPTRSTCALIGDSLSGEPRIEIRSVTLGSKSAFRSVRFTAYDSQRTIQRMREHTYTDHTCEYDT
eukprot:6693969-Prymnesium_polylepis.1